MSEKKLLKKLLKALNKALEVHSKKYHDIKDFVHFRGDMINPPDVEEVVKGIDEENPFKRWAIYDKQVEKSFDRLCDFLENEYLHEDFKD